MSRRSFLPHNLLTPVPGLLFGFALACTPADGEDSTSGVISTVGVGTGTGTGTGSTGGTGFTETGDTTTDDATSGGVTTGPTSTGTTDPTTDGTDSSTTTDPTTSTTTDPTTSTTTDPTTSTTTDPTTSSTTSATDTNTDGGSGFVSDTGGGGCGEECDIWNPNDCPSGEKCTAVACAVGGSAWDSNVCRAIQGDAAPGDECMYTDGSGVSGNDTCELGSLCWNADGDTGIGTCLAFCTGSPNVPSCPAGSSCTIVNNGVLPICLIGCDPLAQDCEASTDLCIPDPGGSGYICALDASGGAAPYGTPCNYANSCNPGMICIDATGVPESSCSAANGCCSPMCSISAGAPCPGVGQSCQAVFDPQPPGYEDVGVCTT